MNRFDVPAADGLAGEDTRPGAEDHPRAERDGGLAPGAPREHQRDAEHSAEEECRERADGERAPAEPAEIDADDAGELHVAAAHPARPNEPQHEVEGVQRGHADAGAQQRRPVAAQQRGDGEQDAGHEVARQHDAVRQPVRVEVDERQHDADRREVEERDDDERRAPTAPRSTSSRSEPRRTCRRAAHHVTTANATPVIASTIGYRAEIGAPQFAHLPRSAIHRHDRHVLPRLDRPRRSAGTGSRAAARCARARGTRRR